MFFSVELLPNFSPYSLANARQFYSPGWESPTYCTQKPVRHLRHERSLSPLVLRLTVTPSDLWVSVAGEEGPGFLLPAYTLTTHRYTPESKGRAENSFREYFPSATFSIEPPLDRLRSSPQLTVPSGLIRATSTLTQRATVSKCYFVN